MRNLLSLITHNKPKSPISEAYRTLRTNIQFSSLDKDIKTITVTSSGPGEGKSTVMTNLAVTMAQTGKKVIIVDCDLRKPKVHRVFEIQNNVGFTTALVENVDYKNVVKHVDGIERLDIIPSGPIPPNPSELLGSNRSKEFFEKLKADYDMIIIDAPPIGVVTDAAILSTYVDGLILVAGFGQVEVEAIKRTKELLDKVNAPVLGVVLNKVPVSTGKYYGKYYYYKYYNYYGDENNEEK